MILATWHSLWIPKATISACTQTVDYRTDFRSFKNFGSLTRPLSGCPGIVIFIRIRVVRSAQYDLVYFLFIVKTQHDSPIPGFPARNRFVHGFGGSVSMIYSQIHGHRFAADVGYGGCILVSGVALLSSHVG